MEELSEQQTLFMQQDVKQIVIFISTTLDRNWEKCSINTGTMPKTYQIRMKSHPKYINTNTTRILNQDIEVLVLKGNLHQKQETELWEDKFICLLGTKAPTGLNVELKIQKGVSFMIPLPILLHKTQNFYLILTFNGRTFPLHFLKISAFGD